MTPQERQAALDAMLARGGQGRVASNPQVWQDVVAPAFTGAPGQRAAGISDMWATRNADVAKANSAMVGGYGSALNSARQQDEQEWLRKYQEAQAKARGRGGSRRSGGATTAADAPMTAPTTPTDPYAWLDDYLATITPAAPPPAVTRPRPKPGPTGGQLPKVVKT